MKKSILFLISVITYTTSPAQTNTFDYQPSFSAVITNNIETSVKWYQSVFDLKVKNVIADPNGSYKVTILESPSYTLELLELRGALPRKGILNGKPEDTKIQGHFKMGFNVKDLDACLKRLAELKISVHRVWTDDVTKKRNFLISDPDENLIQFFED